MSITLTNIKIKEGSNYINEYTNYIINLLEGKDVNDYKPTVCKIYLDDVCGNKIIIDDEVFYLEDYKEDELSTFDQLLLFIFSENQCYNFDVLIVELRDNIQLFNIFNKIYNCILDKNFEIKMDSFDYITFINSIRSEFLLNSFKDNEIKYILEHKITFVENYSYYTKDIIYLLFYSFKDNNYINKFLDNFVDVLNSGINDRNSMISIYISIVYRISCNDFNFNLDKKTIENIMYIPQLDIIELINALSCRMLYTRDGKEFIDVLKPVLIKYFSLDNITDYQVFALKSLFLSSSANVVSVFAFSNFINMLDEKQIKNPNYLKLISLIIIKLYEYSKYKKLFVSIKDEYKEHLCNSITNILLKCNRRRLLNNMIINNFMNLEFSKYIEIEDSKLKKLLFKHSL